MIITLVVIAVIVLFAVMTYNSLVGLRQAWKQAFADIDVQLKMRHDLIPNLVETVKGYAAHESGVFEKVTEARAPRCARTPWARNPRRKACSPARSET
jgi:LemA protein